VSSHSENLESTLFIEKPITKINQANLFQNNTKFCYNSNHNLKQLPLKVEPITDFSQSDTNS
jgi:hypothetical protein